MKRFEIFKPGRHIAMSGDALNFTEADLQAAVAAYDPAVHEAPIVVGHPKDNAPAYGWVGKLEFADGAIHAEPKQVDPAFAEMVEAGRFKKRSASFYTPSSPANPKPGTFYLRHVGFLGAMPPAVKGLKDVAFAEQEGVVEFAEDTFAWTMVARALRGLREWIISKHNVEEADKVLPGFIVEDLEAAARKALEPAPVATPSFAEPNPGSKTMTTATIEQAELDTLRAKAAAADAATAKTAEFTEREKAIATKERALARSEIEGQVDALVKAGKVLPASKAQLVEFALALDAGTESIEFGEGDAKKKLAPRACLMDFLGKQPKAVDFTERSGETLEPGAPTVDEAQKKIMGQVTGQATK
jgi:hypothetical protein